MVINRVLISSVMLFAQLPIWGGVAQAETVTAEMVVQRCDLDTYAGDDNRSKLTVILRDVAGNEKKNVYRRFWKNFVGKGDVFDKMVLFTEYPLDAKGTGFMRWAYLPETGKNVDQWLYLPSLKKIRRVSVRDPADRFLGSDLSYWDISLRLASQDKHRLVEEQSIDGGTRYIIESVPMERKPLYSKIIAVYEKASDWGDCNKTSMEYYDPNGSLLKVQTLSWQNVSGAWLWDEVVVSNRKTGHSSTFQVSDISINVGLKDRMFTERALQKGIR